MDKYIEALKNIINTIPIDNIKKYNNTYEISHVGYSYKFIFINREDVYYWVDFYKSGKHEFSIVDYDIGIELYYLIELRLQNSKNSIFKEKLEEWYTWISMKN